MDADVDRTDPVADDGRGQGPVGNAAFRSLMSSISLVSQTLGVLPATWAEGGGAPSDDGFDDHGFHRVTRTPYGPDGYDAEGFDRKGFDRYGRDALGCDPRGFDRDGMHQGTGTPFDPKGYDRWGRDEHGYDRRGFALDGLHRDTGTPWAPDGFDCHGRDARGRYRWAR